MVSAESVNVQLKKLGFNIKAFSNRAELRELPNIIIPDEEIFECVNGFYEGGAALLVATNIRVLLVDKKPLNFLTVEDLRYDMINQMDYSHRLFGANITISVGNKNLNFKSYNKTRLRKLINHVQHCIADLKKQQNQHQEGQNQHLEQINQQLQAYLVAQYQNQLMLNQRLQDTQPVSVPDPNRKVPFNQIVQPSPELADYLFAQSLLRQHEQQQKQATAAPAPVHALVLREKPQPTTDTDGQQAHQVPRLSDLYEAGRREIFSKYLAKKTGPELIDQASRTESAPAMSSPEEQQRVLGFEINPLRIACAKLPMALRNRRRFGRYRPINRGDSIPVLPQP